MSRLGFLLVLVGVMVLISCNIKQHGKAQNDSAEEVALALETLPDSLTFWADVAPIVFENCTPCHYAEGAGPFPLTQYGDLKKRTKTIRLAISEGFMPPWPADPDYSTFKDEKILTDREQAMIIGWIDQGAVEGEIPTMPPTPAIFEEVLGPPDLVIPFPERVQINGDGKDAFYVAKLTLELEKDTILRAIFFSPGNRKLVHHANGNLINYAEGKKQTVTEGSWLADAEISDRAGVFADMALDNDDGTYPPLLVSAFNYLPGVEPLAYPEGIGGIYLKKKSVFLLNTLHYGPSAKDTTDGSEIHLYFAERKPERPVFELQLGTLGISEVVPEFRIPAGKVTTFTTRYKVTSPISVLTVNPHMHLLGKSMIAYAVSGNRQDTIPLIRIPDWDFRWQYFYTYPTMLKIPAGYEIVAEATFDNTMENPLNPNRPPKTIKEAGENMKTTDEMFQFFITYVPFRAGDESIKL